MKKIIVIITLILSSVANAQSADSLFVQANKLYQQEQYAEALALYEKIASSDVESDDLYYNMGNAYYKTNQIAPAIYNYEKALLLNPSHSDASYNLSFAKRMALDNIEALPKSIGQKFSEVVVQKFNYNTWAYIGVVFIFLMAILFLLYHFSYSSGLKRFYFISSIACAFITVVSVVFAYANFEHIKNYKTAIVFAEQSSIKSAPTASGEISFELHEGTKVQLLESLDGYKKIKIADGKIGWISEEDIKELE